MSYSRLHSRLLSAALAATVAFGGVACNGNLNDPELALGEATAFLTTSEEGGEVGADAVAGAPSDVLASTADEQAALAGGVPDGAGGVCDFSAKREQVLAEYDANHDGRLDREELQALRADLGLGVARPRFFRLGWRARVWAFWRVRWAFDEDGSGSLSQEERTALVDALEARCNRLQAKLLETFDADKNGTLDDSERQAAREAFREKLLAARQELLAKYDANQNGILEDSERLQLRADRLQAAQERRAALMAQYDTNHDGTLSTEEALPLRKAIQDRIINGSDAE